jgi:predicted nucleotidyltransferase
MTQPTPEEVTERIVEHFAPERVVLFGSCARGTATDESDVDLFVEMESDKRAPERIAEVLSLFGLRPWSLDVVVYTPEEVRRIAGKPGTFLARIEAGGRTIYAPAQKNFSPSGWSGSGCLLGWHILFA